MTEIAFSEVNEMSLESNKMLGGVGALLMVIGFIGMFAILYAVFLVPLGIIIVLISMKGLADHYQESGIFNNALYGFIALIVGFVAFIATMIIVALRLFSTAIDWTNPAEVQQYFMNLDNPWSLVGTALTAFVVLFIFLVISGVLFRKSLDSLSARSGEKLFGTAGLIWLIGAVLSIILVGFIMIWIAWILMAVGFFSIKTAAPPPQTPPTSSTTITINSTFQLSLVKFLTLEGIPSMEAHVENGC